MTEWTPAVQVAAGIAAALIVTGLGLNRWIRKWGKRD